MKLSEWISRQPRGAVARLAKSSGVSRTSLWRAVNGFPVSYRTAVRIVSATGGAVGIHELCRG